MTEAQWFRGNDPDAMLHSLRSELTPRKLRLFACACCWSVKYLLTDVWIRNAVEVVERFADSPWGWSELRVARQMAGEILRWYAAHEGYAAHLAAAQAVVTAATDDIRVNILRVAQGTAEAKGYAAVRGQGYHLDYRQARQLREQVRRAERQRQAETLRELFGNPFRKQPALSGWPTDVVCLAQALYDGEGCAYALHDALLENGFVEIAEHFQVPHHPKGCWAMDWILGKS